MRNSHNSQNFLIFQYSTVKSTIASHCTCVQSSALVNKHSLHIDVIPLLSYTLITWRGICDCAQGTLILLRTLLPRACHGYHNIQLQKFLTNQGRLHYQNLPTLSYWEPCLPQSPGDQVLVMIFNLASSTRMLTISSSCRMSSCSLDVCLFKVCFTC